MFEKKIKKTFIVAEIGNNHEGSFEIAKKLIIEAHKCGVDAVKFQTFDTKNYISKRDSKRFKRNKKFELSYNQFIKLSKLTKSKKMKFISTPFDIKSAEFLSKIVDIFKISSGDNNYKLLIEKVLSFKKTTLISTGLLTEKEIVDLKNFIYRHVNNFNLIWFLHCVSSYPVSADSANLNFIKKMISKISPNIGYSDHTIGIVAPIIAVTYGAKIIEKHFTLDNNFSNFRDHKISLNPENMKKMVQYIKDAEKMISKNILKISHEEKKNLKSMRRSLYVNKPKKRYEKINLDDLLMVRPEEYFKVNDYKKVIGKKLKKNIDINHPLKRKHLS